MAFFLAAGVLTLLVAAMLVRPLLRALAPPPTAERYNAAVYRDQLDELEQDGAREALGAAEVVGARLEIERRLIATAKAPEAAPEPPHPPPVAAAVALTAAFALGAVVIYLAVGAPMAQDHPFEPPAPRGPGSGAPESGAPGSGAPGSGAPGSGAPGSGAPGSGANPGADADASHGSVEPMIAALRRRLQTHPQDAAGWGLLARSLMRLDRPAEAVSAYAHAIAATPKPDPQLYGGYGEAQVMAAGGRVDAEALALFRRLHAVDPANPEARYYLALAKAQGGDTAGAVAAWRALEAASPPGAPWLPTVRARILEASGHAGAATPHVARTRP